MPAKKVVKSFEVSLEETQPGVRNPVPLTFELLEREITAQPPTGGQLIMMMRDAQGGTNLEVMNAIIDFMTDVCDKDDLAYMVDLVHRGMDINVLNQIVSWMIGEWSGNPTGSSSASSSSRKRTGST